jgi:NADH:ubiquinone reductase (H+-translocating)
VLWAAGVEANVLGAQLGVPLDRQGRVIVERDLSVPGHPEIFVLGDLARFEREKGGVLPGVAPVAMQQGRHVSRVLRSGERAPFVYLDKGQMATIGRRRAIVETGRTHATGAFAWLMWLVVHIYYLSGFQNRLLVLIQWAWSYLTFSRGARLIVEKDWRSHAGAVADPVESAKAPDAPRAP